MARLSGTSTCKVFPQSFDATTWLTLHCTLAAQGSRPPARCWNQRRRHCATIRRCTVFAVVPATSPHSRRTICASSDISYSPAHVCSRSPCQAAATARPVSEMPSVAGSARIGASTRCLTLQASPATNHTWTPSWSCLAWMATLVPRASIELKSKLVTAVVLIAMELSATRLRNLRGTKPAQEMRRRGASVRRLSGLSRAECFHRRSHLWRRSSW